MEILWRRVAIILTITFLSLDKYSEYLFSNIFEFIVTLIIDDLKLFVSLGQHSQSCIKITIIYDFNNMDQLYSKC